MLAIHFRLLLLLSFSGEHKGSMETVVVGRFVSAALINGLNSNHLHCHRNEGVRLMEHPIDS